MIVLYASGHGYGHATRQAAVAAALRGESPDVPVAVRTRAPAWIFAEHAPGVAVSRGGDDPGMVQKDALDIDLPASLAAHEALGRRWDELVASEAAWLRAAGARLVVGDIAPVAFAAAAAAGLPSVGVSNFCWDWIFEPYGPAWETVRRRYADAYARAELALRLPLHGDFPAFKKVEDVPLVSRMGTAAKRSGKPLVLAAFGGFGVDIPFDDPDDLTDFAFCGFGPKPNGLRAEWRRLRPETSTDQLEALASCDVVLSKPGYGIVSEALAHGKRMLYVPREGFREIGPLLEGLTRRGAALSLGREAFLAGRWREPLEALLSLPAPAPVPAEGALVVARRLLGLLS